MRIRAAVLQKPGDRIHVETADLQDPKKGEVLVRIRAAGVCHSDWHVVTGATPHPLPVVLGHEGAGIVEAVGPDVRAVRPGDHVSLNWAPACGQCFYCTHGRPCLCSTFVGPLWAGTMMDGTTRLRMNGKTLYHFNGLACFADRAVVPEECCVQIPPSVPFEIAALIGCAVTTGVGAALYTAAVEPGSSVAVFGCGGVGLSIIFGSVLAGARHIIAVDRTSAKKTLTTRAGATEYCTSGKAVQAIREITEGRGADFVFEAIGIPAVQEQALESVRPGGLLVLAGISPVGSSTNFPGAILTRQEKTVKGSYYGTSDPRRDFPKFARLYLEKKLPLDLLISTLHPLEEINEAYERMVEGETARGLIVFGDS